MNDEGVTPGRPRPDGAPARGRRWPLVALLFALLAAGSGPATAQTPLKALSGQFAAGPGDEAALSAPSVATLNQSLADVQRKLAAIEGPDRLAAGAPADAPPTDLQQRVRLLRLTAFAYRQHLNALGSLAEQQKSADEAAARRQAWHGPEGKPPYSVLLADGLRAELQVSQLNLHSEEGRLRILTLQLDNARESLVKAGERRRLAQEALESATPKTASIAAWKRDLAVLEERAAGAYAAALTAQRQVIEAGIAAYRQEVEFRQRNIAEVERALRFDDGDLERLQADIDERRSQTIRAMEHASNERERLAGELARADARNSAAGQRVGELLAGLGNARKALAEAEAALTRAEQPENPLGKMNPFRSRTARADLEQKQAALADRGRGWRPPAASCGSVSGRTSLRSSVSAMHWMPSMPSMSPWSLWICAVASGNCVIPSSPPAGRTRRSSGEVSRRAAAC